MLPLAFGAQAHPEVELSSGLSVILPARSRRQGSAPRRLSPIFERVVGRLHGRRPSQGRRLSLRLCEACEWSRLLGHLGPEMFLHRLADGSGQLPHVRITRGRTSGAHFCRDIIQTIAPQLPVTVHRPVEKAAELSVSKFRRTYRSVRKADDVRREARDRRRAVGFKTRNLAKGDPRLRAHPIGWVQGGGPWVGRQRTAVARSRNAEAAGACRASQKWD